MSVASQILDIRASLPAGVTLVAVSKFHSAEAILEAYGAGQRIFGESRVQELKLKAQSLPKDIEWHMIGHLQTNKVRTIAPFVSLIQSVDSQRLIECINSEAARCDRVIDCLLEVHVSSDESKSGWDLDELRSKYEIQLKVYEKALNQVFGKRETELIIYSFRLSDQIVL